MSEKPDLSERTFATGRETAISTKATRLTQWTSIGELWDRYPGARPSLEAVEFLKALESNHPEVRALAERTLWHMRISGLGGRNISPAMAWWIGKLAPEILVGAVDGVVPPITMAGRHSRIDDYLAETPGTRFGDGATMLELGCAFPSLTALDTAARFPEWRVIGVDKRPGSDKATHPSFRQVLETISRWRTWFAV